MRSCRHYTAYASVFCALTATQLAAVSTAEAVPNDTIAQATPLEPRKPIRATNVGALTEPGDTALVCPASPPFDVFPDRKPGGAFAQQASVWWRFTRGPQTTVISTYGSTFKTTLVVWRRTAGGPLEVIDCATDPSDGSLTEDEKRSGVDRGALVYLQRQRGRGKRVPPDPPGTEYFAQVGGCIGAPECGTGVGNIRLGVYEGIDDTLLGFNFFVTCRSTRVRRLRLANLPKKARVVAEWVKNRQRPRRKAIRVRRGAFDARRLTGSLSLSSDPDDGESLSLKVTAPGRVGREFIIRANIRGRGKSPTVIVQCLFPGRVIGEECLWPDTRYRDPNVRCGRGRNRTAIATAREAGQQ